MGRVGTPVPLLMCVDFTHKVIWEYFTDLGLAITAHVQPHDGHAPTGTGPTMDSGGLRRAVRFLQKKEAH
jgi:RNA 3'-terminal phosphate cyclase